MNKLQQLIDTLCPNGVEYKKLGEIANCYAGATPKTTNKEYWVGGSIPWMSSGEVNKKIIKETDNFITQLGYDSCSTKLVPSNSVVIALAGQGKTRGLVALTKIELCTNQSLCAIVPSEKINSSFLYHFLSSQYQQLRAVSSGDGTRGGLNLKMVNSYIVPVPPLAVQEEIARILDRFAEYTAELQAELQARKEQYEYYRNLLLTFNPSACGCGTDDKQKDNVTMPPPASYKIKWMAMGEIGTFIRGNGLQKKDFTESGIGCIHYGQIYTHYGTFADKTLTYVSKETAARSKIASQNDLIIAITSENMEDVCKCVAWLGENDIAVSAHATIFKHHENPKYLAYYLQTRAFESQKIKYARGAKVIEISPDQLAKIVIPIPPMAEQERIVSILDKFEALTNDLQAGLPAEIEARKQQYEYFRNKLLTFKKIS